MLGRLLRLVVPSLTGRERVGRGLLAAAVAVLAIVFIGPCAALACTTAASPRPVADYRAATPVVLGAVEEVGPGDITVRLQAVYRGAVGGRLRLTMPGPSTDWCAFPWGLPAVGTRVLLAVVDPSRWDWPNSATWIVDGQGRILSPPEAPWSGAPSPATVTEALRTMGITLPTTATTATQPAAASRADPFGSWVLLTGLAGIMAFALGWRRAARRRGAWGGR